MADVFDKVRKMLERHVAQQLTALGNPLPVSWPNAPFNQPADGKWARVTVLFGRAVPVSLGGGLREVLTGTVMVQVFVPRHVGTGQAFGVADMFAKFLRYRQLVEDDVVVDIGPVSVDGQAEEAGWYMVVLRADWTAHHQA